MDRVCSSSAIACGGRHFGADPSVPGRVVAMNDRQYTIIGVMPPSFEPLISEHFYQPADMWAPVGYDRTLTQACRSCQHLKAIGRLKSDTTLEAARLDIDRVQAALRREFPADYAASTMTLVRLGDELTGRLRPALTVLMGAVALVLVIACANVANLLLARMSQRERDLALRSALGASRGRLVRQQFAESLLLAGAGGGAGVLISAFVLPLLTRLAPSTISRLTDAQVDGRVLAFSAALSVGTAIVFGLLPSLRASRIDVLSFLARRHPSNGSCPDFAAPGAFSSPLMWRWLSSCSSARA